MTETQNVATYARIRPYNPAINEDKTLTARCVAGTQILNKNGDNEDSYNFTKVFDMSKTTEDLFTNGMKPLLDFKILQGINSIFIVYGQSGSGKSFTLIGEPGHLGVLPMSLQYLLEQENVERIDISSIEAYGIRAAKIGFYDLVQQLKAKQQSHKKKYDAYATKDNPRLNPQNAEMIEITNDNCLKVITELQAVSHMAPTLKNPHSSRGHTCYFCRIKITDLEYVYFVCVDLAGSEGQTALGTKDEFINGLKMAMSKGKLKLNKKQMKGFAEMYKVRSLEAGCINNGLTQLQTIFDQLIKKKISKSQGLGLRKVLSSFISLNSAYSILFTLSASANNNKVTRATLNFAKQTQLVKVHTKKAKKKVDKDKIIKELKQIIKELREEMEQMQFEQKVDVNTSDDSKLDDSPPLNKQVSIKEQKHQRERTVRFSKIEVLNKQISDITEEDQKWKIHLPTHTRMQTLCLNVIPEIDTNEQEMKEVFDQFDQDGSGTICAEELQNALKLAGQEMSMEEVNALFEEYDDDNNGVLDFEEFRSMYSLCSSINIFQNQLVASVNEMVLQMDISVTPEISEHSDTSELDEKTREMMDEKVEDYEILLKHNDMVIAGLQNEVSEKNVMIEDFQSEVLELKKLYEAQLLTNIEGVIDEEFSLRVPRNNSNVSERLVNGQSDGWCTSWFGKAFSGRKVSNMDSKQSLLHEK